MQTDEGGPRRVRPNEPVQQPGLRRFSSSNLVESGLFQVKGLNLGRALDLVANHLIDRGKAFPVVPFGVFLCFPEAQSQQALGILLGDQNNLVNESGLTLQEREDSIVDGTGKLPRLSGFAGDCYYSGKHKRYSFRFMRKVVPSPLGAIDLSTLRLNEEKINRSWKEKSLSKKAYARPRILAHHQRTPTRRKRQSWKNSGSLRSKAWPTNCRIQPTAKRPAAYIQRPRTNIAARPRASETTIMGMPKLWQARFTG